MSRHRAPAGRSGESGSEAASRADKAALFRKRPAGAGPWAIALVLSLALPAFATDPPTEHKPCRSDPSRQEARSAELQAIVNADQADRKDWASKPPEEMAGMATRDVARRKRVGEIFGEGCFSKAEDYAAAALVYQHGDVPDHYLQAFLWAKRAVELGDASQKRMMAVAIDRYLVNIGHKQLFASQATKPDGKPESCWCLDPIEPTFPESRRKEFGGQSLEEAFAWLEELNEGKECPAAECAKELKASPAGTVPGFW